MTLDPFEKRAHDPMQSAAAIQGQLFQKLSSIREGLIFVERLRRSPASAMPAASA